MNRNEPTRNVTHRLFISDPPVRKPLRNKDKINTNAAAAGAAAATVVTTAKAVVKTKAAAEAAAPAAAFVLISSWFPIGS